MRKSKFEVETNWIAIEPTKSPSAINNITVAFTQVQTKTGNQIAYLRVGLQIMEKMGWKLQDKLGIFYDQDDEFKWMICKSEKGYSLGLEANCKSVGRIAFTWRKLKSDYTRAREAQYEINKESIILQVPVGER